MHYEETRAACRDTAGGFWSRCPEGQLGRGVSGKKKAARSRGQGQVAGALGATEGGEWDGAGAGPQGP